eukprot:3138640-Amphidinium_carterae.1
MVALQLPQQNGVALFAVSISVLLHICHSQSSCPLAPEQFDILPKPEEVSFEVCLPDLQSLQVVPSLYAPTGAKVWCANICAVCLSTTLWLIWHFDVLPERGGAYPFESMGPNICCITLTL